MLDQDTLDWAESHPDKFRKWRNKGGTLFWFTITNGQKTKRVAAAGSNIHDAQSNLDVPNGWEIME